MATQVLSGQGDITYTNSTGQNVRLVINFIFGNNFKVEWGGSTKLKFDMVAASQIANKQVCYGKNLAFLRSDVTAASYAHNTTNNTDDIPPPPMPTEVALANGHTFAITGNVANGTTSGWNILIIPETG